MTVDNDTTPQTTTGGSLRSRLAAALGAATRSRTVLVATITVVVLAVAGATYGYSSLSTTVTVSVDGQEREVTAFGDTVGEVLDAEGIDVGEHDLVQPDLDEPVDDGGRIAVRYGRQIELTVDGKTSTHWVTATSVEDALQQIGSGYGDARLSTSRGTSIDRGGIELEVVTPKRLTVTLAGRKPVTKTVPALTVEEALTRLGVKVDRHDQVTPGLRSEVEDGDKVTYVDVEVDRKRFARESFSVATVEREDDSMTEGTTEVAREGRAGVRDVTYRVVTRNGEVVERKIVRQEVIEEPVARIVLIGTAEPEPEPTSNFASGGTVWDQLAQCESGGNWAINTGNGYYGGLQFNLGTWQSYGGTGYPHQASRETQIMIAERVRAATGGYGSWPACAASLGLPT